MATEPLIPTTSPAPLATVEDVAPFKIVADLIKLLPTGTVFAYQFLSPLLTLLEHCSFTNKLFTLVLLGLCGLSCLFASFTDSYLDGDGKIYYGVVTPRGMKLFFGPNPVTSRDLSGYKLRLADFVHAVMALAVFAVIVLVDKNIDIISCYYPSFASYLKTLNMWLPLAIGIVAGFLFTVSPGNRHGLGYPPSYPVNKPEPCCCCCCSRRRRRSNTN